MPSTLTRWRKRLLTVNNIIKLALVLLAGAAVVRVVNALDPQRELRATRDSLVVVLAQVRDSNAQLTEQVDTAIATTQLTSAAARRAGDSLAAALAKLRRVGQGEVRIDTVYRPLESGAMDTVAVGTVIVAGVPVAVPVPVAQELRVCRDVARNCGAYRDSVLTLQASLDTLLGAPATDTSRAIIGMMPSTLARLEAEIAQRQRLQEVNKQLVEGRRLNLGLLTIPRPGLSCGIGGGYRLTGGKGLAHDDDDDYGRGGVSRWVLVAGCLAGWQVF